MIYSGSGWSWIQIHNTSNMFLVMYNKLFCFCADGMRVYVKAAALRLQVPGDVPDDHG